MEWVKMNGFDLILVASTFSHFLPSWATSENTLELAVWQNKSWGLWKLILIFLIALLQSIQNLGTLQPRHMQNQDFWQSPHYFQDLPCLENWSVGVTESLKGQVKRDYSQSPCAALCWNRHRAPRSSTKARDHLCPLLPSHSPEFKMFHFVQG